MLANVNLRKVAVSVFVVMGFMLFTTAYVQGQIPQYSLDTILNETLGSGVDLSPDGSKIYASKTFGPNDNGFIVYSTETYEMLTEYHVAGVPWQGRVSADGQYLWAGIYYGGYVKKLNADTGSVITSIDVGSWVYGLAFDSQRRYLYVGENVPGGYSIGSIQRVDTVTESVVGSTTLNGEPAGAIYVSPDDTYIYALSLNSGSERLHKIRTSDMGIEGTFDLPGVGDAGFSLSPDGSKAYVPEPNEDIVHVVDLQTMTETDQFSIENPCSFFVSPDGTHALTMLPGTSPEPDYVRIFDLSTESIVQSISLGDRDLQEPTHFRTAPSWGTAAGLDAVYIPLRSGDGGVAVLTVPEPSTLALLSMGTLALLAHAHRKRRRR